MKWFSLGLALICLFALQIVIEAKPVEEEEAAAASTDADETPANDETPTETNDETPAETHAETPAESSKESSSSESSDDSSESGNKVISAPTTTKKPWTIEGIHNDAKMIMETIKDGIETTEKALELYDKLVDRVIPYDEFKKTLDSLDEFRKEYSTESAELIGQTKTLVLNGMDEYHSASRNVYEWASAVTPRLRLYLKLFNKNDEQKAQAQRTLLVSVLDDGIKKMSEARKDLEESSKSFNEAGGKLESLTMRFGTEFDEKSEFVQAQITRTKIIAYSGGAIFGIPGLLVAHYVAIGKFVPQLMEKLKKIEEFYTDFKTKIQTGGKQIEDIKSKIVEEIHHIGELKAQTEDTKTSFDYDEFPDMRDEIIKSVNNLIKHCDEYRKRHNSKLEGKSA